MTETQPSPPEPTRPARRRVAQVLLASGLSVVVFLTVWVGMAATILIYVHAHPQSELDADLAKSDMKVAWTVFVR